MKPDDEVLGALLPHGASLRPLLLASNINDADLKVLLNRRGVYPKLIQPDATVPLLCSILLSPKELDILRNRITEREVSLKASTAQSLLNEGNQISIPDFAEKGKIEASINRALGNYRSVVGQGLHVSYDEEGSCVIEGTVKRTDWKKDYLTQTTEHPFRMVISKDEKNNCLNYNCQYSTACAMPPGP